MGEQPMDSAESVGEVSPGMAVRTAYLDGLAALEEMIGLPSVGDRWSTESVLEAMPISSLVGHLGLSALQVERFLDQREPETHRVDAVTYVARLTNTDQIDSAFNRSIVERATVVAADGYGHVVQSVAQACRRLAARLQDEPGDQTVGIAHRPGEVMLLDEYLRTRCVELAVHLDDLAVSLTIEPTVPETTSRVAAVVLFEAARQRHGSQAILLAMARRERDHISALRVL